MKFDPIAISNVLRGNGLDLDPTYFLPDDEPQPIGPGRYEVETIGRMGLKPVGKRVVRWTGKRWELERPNVKKPESTDPLGATVDTLFGERE